mmetsp:Transcript_98416/g.317460  ORF Transcript_98416/g.317460 Transcript_98416/m.317460 type:complete len:793 (+) Transcript_98416:188-2566(+)
MVLPLLAASAFANVGAVVSYNRANFLYNSGQKIQRAYTGISYQLQLFNLYRQDVRDIVALTTDKMTHYHVIACLELGMVCTMLGPARLPSEVPSWLLWHQLACLCASMTFLVASMWLATRAVVVAGSFNVRMQTQYIRLPVPDDEMLDEALTKAEDFEGQDFDGLLRLPFIRSLWNFFSPSKGSEEGDAEDDEECPLNAKKHTEAHGATPKMINGQPMSHLKLYQVLQRKWMCYDAYARVTLSVGTYWLILSLAYYELGWNMCAMGKAFPAIMAALMFCFILILLVYLDVTVSSRELAAVSLLICCGPMLAALGAAQAEPGETPWHAAAAGVVQFLFTAWVWHVGGMVPGKMELPFRFKGVAYLDIFGPLVNELQSVLANSGFAENAHTDKPDQDAQVRAMSPRSTKTPSGKAVRFATDSQTPGETNEARTLLSQAMFATGSRQLSQAIQAAKRAGLDASDRQLREAEAALERLQVPRDIRRLRKVMLDWRHGEVWHHLEHEQMLLLESMLSDTDAMLGRLQSGPPRAGGATAPEGRPPQRARPSRMGPLASALPLCGTEQPDSSARSPRIFHRGGSVESAASSVYVPAWTKVSDDGAGSYWVGTSTEEGPCSAADAAPGDARPMEFDTLCEQCDDVMTRAARVANGNAFGRARASASQSMKRQASGQSLRSLDSGLTDDGKGQGGKRKRPQDHHPVMAFRLMSGGLVLAWFSGIVYHTLSLKCVQDVAPWEMRRQLSSAGVLFPISADLAATAPTFVWPVRFFSPTAKLVCRGDNGTHAPAVPNRLTASNG